MGEKSVNYLQDKDLGNFNWAKSIGEDSFVNLELQEFLSRYCWVVYASGFRFSTIKALFPQIAEAFKGFKPDSLGRMRSIKPVLAVFNNERKARSFLSGAKQVIEEGFSSFKDRLRNGGPDILLELGGIGPITKDHLAKNIGLADVAKADIWLQRAADICGAPSVDKLVRYLSVKLGFSAHVIDIALWTYAKDGELLEFAKGVKGNAFKWKTKWVCALSR